MNYYKIIKDGIVIDVNHVFLRWQEKHRILIGCDASDAQFIQSSDGEEIYRARWLNPYPTEAGEYETVEAVEISEDEYIDLRQMLDLGERPEMPEPEESNSKDDSDDRTENNIPEEVMDVAAMRRAIIELRDQNSFLEECLLEMSQVVYA